MDLIDRQAAIDVLAMGEEFLKRVLDAVDVVGYERKKYEWGLDLIESYILDMRELPSAQPEPCEDAVSRHAIFDTAAEYEKQLCEILGDENELVEVVEILKHRLIALPSAQPEKHTETHSCDLITKIQNGIEATDANDVYSCGMRNGMRWCMSLIDDKEPKYENCPPAPPERKKGKWVHGREIAREMVGDAVAAIFYEGWQCSECKYIVEEEREPLWNFCPNCGADMRGEQEE